MRIGIPPRMARDGSDHRDPARGNGRITHMRQRVGKALLFMGQLQ